MFMFLSADPPSWNILSVLFTLFFVVVLICCYSIVRILTAPYENRDGWEMNVMNVDGTLYFEEHLTEAKLQEK